MHAIRVRHERRQSPGRGRRSADLVLPRRRDEDLVGLPRRSRRPLPPAGRVCREVPPGARGGILEDFRTEGQGAWTGLNDRLGDGSLVSLDCHDARVSIMLDDGGTEYSRRLERKSHSFPRLRVDNLRAQVEVELFPRSHAGVVVSQPLQSHGIVPRWSSPRRINQRRGTPAPPGGGSPLPFRRVAGSAVPVGELPRCSPSLSAWRCLSRRERYQPGGRVA